jgi:hypothetical protein
MAQTGHRPHSVYRRAITVLRFPVALIPLIAVLAVRLPTILGASRERFHWQRQTAARAALGLRFAWGNRVGGHA